MAGKSYWLFVDFNLSIFNVNEFTPAQFYFYLSYLLTIKGCLRLFNAIQGFLKYFSIDFLP